MKWIVLAATALVFTVGCKAKIEGDGKVEQQSCTRQLVPAPQEFGLAATVVTGAVQTENCDILAVGTSSDNQPLIARYDRNGERIRTFASNGFYRPLAAHPLSAYAVTLQRLALLPDGIVALGWFNTVGGGDLLAMKIKSDGILNFEFGPKRDGVLRGDNVSGQTVRNVDAPNILDEKYFSLLVTYFSNATGTQFTKAVRLSMNGREELPRLKFNTPGNCEIVNHSGVYDGNAFRLTQNECHSLMWTAQGRGVNDNFQVMTDGSVYTSAALGEFSIHYEVDGRPVLTSLDGLGNAKNEFMIFVEGRSNICGLPVNPNQRYLVFTRKLPGEADFLANCWFM